MNNFNLGSWKTTVGGIVSLLAGLGMLGKILNAFMLNEPISFEEITVAVGTISAGLAAIFARDNNVSSQDVGIR